MGRTDDEDAEHGTDDAPGTLAAVRSGPSQWLGPWWLGVAGLAVAGLLLVSQNLRAYGYALGATLAVLAVLRAVLPDSRVGGLAVRGRWVDVTTLLALGIAVAALASTLRLQG